MKYFLVFGTNHEDGVELMREAMQNCGTGKFAYAPTRPEISDGQMSITAINEEQQKEKLKDSLTEKYDNMSLSFNRVVADYVTEERYQFARRSEIRSALKELESSGRVQVNRVTSKTSRGLGGDDKIIFR